MKIIVTGSAGFIGSFCAHKLLDRGDVVVGVDNINSYYDVALKQDRLARLESRENFSFFRADIVDSQAIKNIMEKEQPDRLLHLAAQAGVRYSLENPSAYVNANLVGFLNILEAVRDNGIEHLVYASTSSVYGGNSRLPFSIQDSAVHPLTLYAATKKSNELMAHAYSHLFQIPTTGLRFFTVYGPWGRPDMALFEFTRKILHDQPINVFNYGRHSRDFTYIDDVVEGVTRILDKTATPNLDWQSESPDPSSSSAPYRIYNVGSGNPQPLDRYIDVLEQTLGRKATKNYLPMQPGDVPATYADVEGLHSAVDYRPNTSIENGIRQFVDWYMEYYDVTRR